MTVTNSITFEAGVKIELLFNNQRWVCGTCKYDFSRTKCEQKHIFDKYALGHT